MIQTDFRALCAELVDELNYHADEHSVDKLIARARLALTTPPPPPTDEELLRLYGVATPCYHVEEYKRELDFARVVLERWRK